MDKKLQEQIIESLRDAASTIWSKDYDQWYGANTMRSHEEWMSDYTKEQIDSLYDLADKLEEME